MPVPPAQIARDPSGRTTVRASRVTSPMRIDGALDEEIYASLLPITDFIQNDPQEGAPSTEKTELWIMFDRDNVYVTARCWDSHPERIIANEMRRDSTNIVQSNDGFGFAFDTFHDGRNSVGFEVSAAGGRLEGQITNERQVNLDWNPVWNVTVARFAQGWTMEAAVPFKSLRYRAGREQVWGFNARRVIRWKNESTYMVPIPASMTLRGHLQASLMPTLVGLEAPAGSANLEIKPYAITQMTTNRLVTPRVSNDFGGDAGIDAKFAVTQGLTADLTYNTDFAQVEADEQQVNLTRFSLFFPEKRDFFLENQGTFAFGGIVTFSPSGGGGGGSAGGGGGGTATNDTPVLFYSRRIGLANGREVPILGGGRLSGRSGRYSGGVINVQARDDEAALAEATNFTVARVKRDLLRKSSIGALATHRSVSQSGRGMNDAYGVDSTFAFYDNLAINACPRHAPARTGATATTPVTARSSTTRAIGTERSWSASSSGRTSIRTWATCAGSTCTAVTVSCASAPGQKGTSSLRRVLHERLPTARRERCRTPGDEDLRERVRARIPEQRPPVRRIHRCLRVLACLVHNRARHHAAGARL